MNLRILPALSVLAACVLVPAASAQELGVRYQKKNVSIGLSIGHHGTPVRYAPRPIRYERREWVPSHYETITEKVWVPGVEQRVFVPAVYEWRTDSCGRLRKVLVCAAHYETRCTPGRYELVTRQVWVEGGWRMRHCD
jgi:hypothetical protein